MWLRDCHKLYPEIIERHSGQPQNLGQVEREVRHANVGNQVTARVLQLIENSAGWTYPSWWPVLSEKIKEPIELPVSLHLPQPKHEAVKLLFNRLRHIEVVSVILRFIRPDEFGILSPPVMNLVNLPRAGNHVELYCRYLSLLTKFREHYGDLKKIADFDMALWCAAHLDPSEHRFLWNQMLHDSYFQEVCLSNLLEGFGKSWGQSDRERLILAKTLLNHDYILAALIAARCFEAMIRLMAKKWNIYYVDPRAELSDMVNELANSKGKELLRRGISPGSLKVCRQYRNTAVHVNPPIERKQAESLVTSVMEIFSRLEGN